MARSPKYKSRRSRSRSKNRDRHRKRLHSRERRSYREDERSQKTRRRSADREHKSKPKTSDEIEKEKENKKLELEMKKRRERIEKWREERKRRQAAIESLTAKQGGSSDQSKGGSRKHRSKNSKKWNLENDDDDDEIEHEAAAEALPAPISNGKADRGNKDLETNAIISKTLVPPHENMEEDDVDPLDEFMMGIKDEVKKIKHADRIKLNVANSTSATLQTMYVTQLQSQTQNIEEKPIPPAPKPTIHTRGELVEQGQDLLEYSSEEEELSYHEMMASMNSHHSKLDKFMSSMGKTYFEYPAFEKNFYNEVPEIANMTPQEVAEYRTQLGDVQVRGKNCPKPIKTWAQAGLTLKILEILKKLNFTTPTPIQAQALPVIMSGRDLIAIAKTGSGKTLAFLLPLFRHLAHQDPPGDEDGPLALIMSPTRELATQIYRDARRFINRIGNIGEVVCIYGGASISEQIAALKRRPTVVVATPGRMIDMLAANSGKVTNLKRITYCVLDEADRMFDMGFEPQVMRILELMRPDRQTVLFSATFPRQMEALARRILKKPIEIQIGGRSVVTDTVEQHVIVLSGDDTKYLKLLEILGNFNGRDSNYLASMAVALQQKATEAPRGTIASMLKTKSGIGDGPDKEEGGGLNYSLIGNSNMQLALIPQADFSKDESKILIFVEKQERADDLLKELMSSGYSCLALHGGLDQFDRDSVIADFKAGNVKILVATSVAARGLDVKNLDVVVNFDCPNHYEDYVHRCGRAGRAGKKGFAYTFITQSQGRMAGELIKALELSKSTVPAELLKLWESYKEEKKAEGVVIKETAEPGGGGGYKGGRGFKFDRSEEIASKENKRGFEKAAIGAFGDSDEEDTTGAAESFDSKLDKIFKGESESITLIATEKTSSLTTTNVISAAMTSSGATKDPVLSSKLDAARKVAAKIMTAGGVAGPDYMQRQTEAFLKGTVPEEADVFEKKRNMIESMAEKLNAKLKYNPDDPDDNVGLRITASTLDQNANIPHLAKFEEEIEINDLPQQCRWKICSRDTVNYISEYADVGIAVKGQFVAPATHKKNKSKETVNIPGTSATIDVKPPRKLYLLIESSSPYGVQMAKAEIKRVIKEELLKIQSNLSHTNKGRYVLF